MKLDRGKSFLVLAASIITSAVLLSAGQAEGEIVFNNLNTPQVGLTANSTGWSAMSFISSPNPMTLESVDVRLLPHAESGMFLVRLFSNAPSNQPGIPIETLSGPSTPDFGTFHYTSSSNSTLLPNLAYWIVFSSTGTTHGYSVGAELPQSGIEFGSTMGGKFSSDAGANWVASNYIINMQVTGTRVVPEPNTYLILCMAAFVLVCKRKVNGRKCPPAATNWPAS